MTGLTLLLTTCLMGQSDPVFDLQAILAPPLNARILRSVEKKGIITEEVIFHSEMDGKKSVDIFAYFSYPKGGRNLPAFIWNGGGIDHATTHTPEFGARRGYAAMHIDFPIPGYRSTGDYPINSGVEVGTDSRQAPIYHGAVALLRAVSYLESRREVDKDRIGMVGSSWGGFFTTLMAGIDPRLKAASSLYGCGSLQLGNWWWDTHGPDSKHDAAFRKRWAATLDPALRLGKVKTPIAWFTGTNDIFYWLPAVMDSHAKAGGPKHMTLLPNYNHALTATCHDQVFAWLDVYLKGAPAFLSVSPLEVSKGQQVGWTFQGPRKAANARILVSYGEPGNWGSRYWLVVPGQIKGQTCTATLPAASSQAWIIGSVIDDKGFDYMTQMIRRDGTDKSAPLVPAYNGCSMWSSFDADQEFLTRHGLPKLPVSGGMVTLSEPKTTLKPIHFTAGIPHVFRARILGKEGAKVTVALQGTFDGMPRSEEKTIQLKGIADDFELAFTPPIALYATLQVMISQPANEHTQMGQIRFEPVRKMSH